MVCMEREKRFRIVDDRVESFIGQSVEQYKGFIGEIRKEAILNNIPVISIESARLLEILTRVKRPKRILEIGTAIGFTSILMADGLAENGKIDTIEIDDSTALKAAENIKKAGLKQKINLIAGDAVDVLLNIQQKYDFVFIDAAKGQYCRYYELCSRMVLPGGIIFADNVLYRGMTAGGDKINRRQRLLVKRLREYISTATNDERFVADVLSIGDGICISYKK